MSSARDLVKAVLDQSKSPHGSGRMTCSIYDTAWLACVSREVAEQKLWWFPSSFIYLLNNISPQGGWDVDHRDTGSLLSSLAGLYALIIHHKQPYQLSTISAATLEYAIDSTKARISQALHDWELESATEVGFELLIPMLLDLLEANGALFSFPLRQRLLEIRATKLANLTYDRVYSGQFASILHSLEVFYNDPDFDFDRIRSQTVFGSMMASPSATAAYLMRTSKWDLEAEAYLNIVISRGTGLSTGAVPSAYPSSCFELIWAISTLLSHGLTAGQLGEDLVASVCDFISDNRVGPHGLLSFAPGLPPDLDDSAKGSTILTLLGRPALSQQIIKEFATPTHFRTYNFERNPSLSANANALLALLLDVEEEHGPEIRKIVVFVLMTIKKSVELPLDKWNVSPYYTTMLVSQALVALLRAWGREKYLSLESPDLRQDIALVITQCLTRILLRQHPNGAWGGVEDTCYATLALAELSNVTLFSPFTTEIRAAFAKAHAYLGAVPLSTAPERVWIEKVKYGSPVLFQAYLLSALASYPFSNLVSTIELGSHAKLSLKTEKTLSFMQTLPAFSRLPRWLAIASWIEGQQFIPKLQLIRRRIFIREGFTDDKYFDLIPFIWCAVNNVNKKFLPSEFLFDMMAISVLKYQADEFMENQIGTHLGDRLNEARTLIERIFVTLHDSNFPQDECKQKPVNHSTYQQAGSSPTHANELNGLHGQRDALLTKDSIGEAKASLQRFVNFVLGRPYVQCASESERALLHQTMKDFLLAHVTQAEDNKLIVTPKPAVNGVSHDHDSPIEQSNMQSFPLPVHQRNTKIFKTWVRTTAAEHTSCCYSWAFMTCLSQILPNARPGVSAMFPSYHAQYVADDVCKHLSTMCRMYNDYGSVVRDKAELNLNCVGFIELRSTEGTRNSITSDGKAASKILDNDDEARDRLMALAQYERSQLDTALAQLRKVCAQGSMDMVDVFVGVTDVFGQIYEKKDIASQRTNQAAIV